eukprot:COSAG06_NODE_1274_length_10048_cov_5.593628_6_plen_34_part_00
MFVVPSLSWQKIAFVQKWHLKIAIVAYGGGALG